MLGLPKITEISKQLPKSVIYKKFNLNAAERAKIDADISKFTIVNEITSDKLNIVNGEKIKSFFVLLVMLKKKDFDDKNIITVSKLIPQNILILLEFNGEVKLAVYHTKLLQTEWERKESLSVELKGLDMDTVWNNIVVQIGNITISKGNTLEEQIAVDEQKFKLQKEIIRLGKLARAEKQPKKKFQIVKTLNMIKQKLEKLK